MNFPKNLLGWLILVVIIAAAAALVYIALAQFGIAIPAWVVSVFWVLLVAFVIIAALKLLFGFGGTNGTPPVG